MGRAARAKAVRRATPPMITPRSHSPLARLLLAGVRFYQRRLRRVADPFNVGLCRYTPTCSVYAVEAIERHGALRGSRLAAARLARCAPWGGTGHDPVPE